MLLSIISYFTDPILLAPFLSSIFMCVAASLMGVLVFVQKKTLIGETLSHATYPGIVVGLFFSTFFSFSMGIEKFFPMIGAFIFALFALFIMHRMMNRYRVSNDAALCIVLAGFFAFGMLLTSYLQYSSPGLARQIELYLFGQVATLGNEHIWIYAIFSLIVIGFIFLFLRSIEVLCFHRDFAKSMGIYVKLLETIIFVFLVFSIVIGVRSIGVILMAGMLIAPAVAARQYTDRLSHVIILSGIFGAFCSSIGFILSVEGSRKLALLYPLQKISFPIGPFIILVASIVAVFSMLFAPKRGVVFRFFRIVHFKLKSQEENILKSIYANKKKQISFSKILKIHALDKWMLHILLLKMKRKGLIQVASSKFLLTPEGEKKAMHISNLHVLWEKYLLEHLGGHAEKIHHNAEEMEHIITKDFAKQLSDFLSLEKENSI